jgi:hypothetical protein
LMGMPSHPMKVQNVDVLRLHPWVLTLKIFCKPKVTPCARSSTNCYQKQTNKPTNNKALKHLRHGRTKDQCWSGIDYGPAPGINKSTLVAKTLPDWYELRQ